MKNFKPISCHCCGLEFVPRSSQSRYCGEKCKRADVGVISAAQFEAIIESVEMVTESGCWIYMGSLDDGGYGVIYPKHGQAKKAHRAMYEHLYGAIPDGMKACHRCDTPSCCNPSHIFIGTQAENVYDAAAKKRMRAPSGDMSPHAKLDWETVRRIRSSNKTAYWWSKELHMAKSTIAKIIEGRSWKDDPRVPTDNRG
jgi:hypothetical protein